MSARVYTAALVGILAALLGWGGLYIAHTSVMVDGDRFFTLWDDAMISMRYARNLVQGHGLVWNPGEPPVQGFSNLGVTLGMAAFHVLPIGAERISLLLQAANLLGLAGLVWLVQALALAGFDGDRRIALSAAAATAASAPLAVWGLQGADTTAVALWLLGALLWLARSGERWPAGLFAYLALGLVIRLDTAIYAAVFLAASLLYGPGRLPRLLRGAVVQLGVLGGLLAFSWLYYGDPLPNTFYLKATGTPVVQMLLFGTFRLGIFWYTALPAFALAVFAVVRGRRSPLLVTCGGVVLAALAYDIRVGSDWAAFYGSRFLVPMLPVLLVLACGGGWRLAGSTDRAGWAFDLSVGVLLLAACVLASPPHVRNEWLGLPAETMFRSDNDRNLRFGRYLCRYSAPETVVAVHWGGVAPYFCDRSYVDVLGKSDRHIARLTVSEFHPGHSKWDWDYVLADRRPDVFLITSRGLDRLAFFREHYERVDSGELTFYLRRDARDLLSDPTAMFQGLERSGR